MPFLISPLITVLICPYQASLHNDPHSMVRKMSLRGAALQLKCNSIASSNYQSCSGRKWLDMAQIPGKSNCAYYATVPGTGQTLDQVWIWRPRSRPCFFYSYSTVREVQRQEN
ncbi:hypothetical protein IW262DRAFT_887075 [Armillaria fumosa]|nr:hypothetical protein IW262DRAFT_887075 [Armillaria fumosa]